jgi:hypothetical protein
MDELFNQRFRTTLSCWACLHRRDVPGNCHIQCVQPDPFMVGDPHGIKQGWFYYPLLFDPTWKARTCKHFEAAHPNKVYSTYHLVAALSAAYVLKVSLDGSWSVTYCPYNTGGLMAFDDDGEPNWSLVDWSRISKDERDEIRNLFGDDFPLETER